MLKYCSKDANDDDTDDGTYRIVAFAVELRADGWHHWLAVWRQMQGFC